MRIAIITDIHEDIESLRAAFHKISRNRCDDIVCLGDISGYSVPYYSYLNKRDAHQCLKLIKENCKYIILGNHDMHAARVIPKNCNFFDYPENWYELDYHERKVLVNNKLWMHEENDLNPLYREEDIQFLKTLPEYIALNVENKKILLSHYFYPNLSGVNKDFYTYPDELKEHFNFMEALGCSISFAGHIHAKGTLVAKKGIIRHYMKKIIALNNASTIIGVPPVTSNVKRNGFCIFDSENMSLEIVRI
ncbi:MAG: metallophosphoesterase family protein [Bacteroidales bacterium]